VTGLGTDELMAILIHAINRQIMIIQDQNLRLKAVEESCITRASTSSYRRHYSRSPSGRREYTISRSRSP
ncbi:hypothetical protein A2U01_0087497, partial [Trifolium medium]|nr:hypothetical protein [Trifolium medium]